MSNELIKIVTTNERQTVLGRDLHYFLEVGTQYTIWFSRMCEYGLIEHQDFVALHHKRLTAQGNETTQFDHQLTLSMAKEISMIQRNEKGKQARQYFIECERKLKQLDKPSYQIEQPFERAKKWIIEQEEQSRLHK